MQIELTFILNFDTDKEDEIRRLLDSDNTDEKAAGASLLAEALTEYGSIEADSFDEFHVCDD